ncbi:MAG: DMT family transporter [Monoglobales bacterium]
MVGIIFSIIAGAAMSFQGVMNTRLGEKIGIYEANAFVQFIGFLLSVVLVLIMGGGDLKGIIQTDKWYLLGGVLAIVITLSVMLGIGNLSPAIAIAIILISQLIVAAVIDAFGILGSEKVVFHWTKFVGVGLMIGGVILFKLK